MPLACDPSQTYKVSLESDEGKTPRPAFLFRYLAKRKYLQAELLYKQTFKNPGLLNTEKQDITPPADMHDRSDKGYDILRMMLAGWENIFNPDFDSTLPESETNLKALPFHPNRIEDALTILEGFELLDKAWPLQVPSVEDKKKLDSPSPCVMDSSAVIAGDNPNAPTNPQQT